MSREDQKKSTLWSSSRWRTRFNVYYFFRISQLAFVAWFFWNLSVKADPNVLVAGFCGVASMLFTVLTMCCLMDFDTILGMEPVYKERVAARLISLYIPEKLFKAKDYDYLSEFNAALSLLGESMNQYVNTVRDTQWLDSNAFQLAVEKISEVETILRDKHVITVLLLDKDIPGRSEIVNSVVSKIYDTAEFIEQITKAGRHDYEGHMTSEAVRKINMVFSSSCEADQIAFEAPSTVEDDAPIWKDKETSNECSPTPSFCQNSVLVAS